MLIAWSDRAETLPFEVGVKRLTIRTETPEFQTVYRQHRPMLERSVAWIVRDNRKLRYRGTVKNDWWLRHRVAAINLKRLIALGFDNINGVWMTSATA